MACLPKNNKPPTSKRPPDVLLPTAYNLHKTASKIFCSEGIPTHSSMDHSAHHCGAWQLILVEVQVKEEEVEVVVVVILSRCLDRAIDIPDQFAQYFWLMSLPT